MNEKEFKECSVVAYPHEIRFLHIKGGHIGYYVDRHVSDYVNKLQEENQQLKGSLQTYEILLEANVEENQQLKENNQAMQEELARTWAKLDKKEEIINKAKEFAKEHIFQFDGDKDFDALLEILDNKGDEK